MEVFDARGQKNRGKSLFEKNLEVSLFCAYITIKDDNLDRVLISRLCNICMFSSVKQTTNEKKI